MVVFVIARQRSGTTVFRQFLSTDPSFVDVGEILHNRFLKEQVHGTEERFYRYLYDLALTNPEVIHPGHHRRLLADFIGIIEARYPGKFVVTDVKYNLFFMIDQNRIYTTSRPSLFEILRNRKDATIHIIRRNKLRLLVSEKLADATGQWSLSTKPGAMRIKAQIRLDANNVLDLIAREIEAEIMVTNLLRKLPNVVTIYYEDFFNEEGSFTDMLDAKMSMFLGQNFSFSHAPKFVKQNPEPLAEIISNHTEILGKLELSPFAWMWHAP